MPTARRPRGIGKRAPAGMRSHIEITSKKRSGIGKTGVRSLY